MRTSEPASAPSCPHLDDIVPPRRDEPAIRAKTQARNRSLMCGQAVLRMQPEQEFAGRCFPDADAFVVAGGGEACSSALKATARIGPSCVLRQSKRAGLSGEWHRPEFASSHRRSPRAWCRLIAASRRERDGGDLGGVEQFGIARALRPVPHKHAPVLAGGGEQPTIGGDSPVR